VAQNLAFHAGLKALLFAGKCLYPGTFTESVTYFRKLRCRYNFDNVSETIFSALRHSPAEAVKLKKCQGKRKKRERERERHGKYHHK
jgi:hypothetical protein